MFGSQLSLNRMWWRGACRLIVWLAWSMKWISEFSLLQLFICQYHVWLAADTHGVLVLLPSYPVLNVVVTSFILICIAHEVHVITRALAKYAVPDDWKAMLRNVIVFSAILLPVCITNGLLVLWRISHLHVSQKGRSSCLAVCVLEQVLVLWVISCLCVIRKEVYSRVECSGALCHSSSHVYHETDAGHVNNLLSSCITT